MKIENSELCSTLPSEFTKFAIFKFIFFRYFDHVKKLSFKQVPDYEYLLSLFKKISSKNGFTSDKKFDWSEQGTTMTNDTVRKNSHMDSKSGQQSNMSIDKRNISKDSFKDLPSSMIGNDLKHPADRKK